MNFARPTRSLLAAVSLSFAIATHAVLAAAQPLVSNPTERQQIEKAVPTKALAQPRKARKLLIFDLNVGYGGHPSSRHASYAFTLMGQRTGAFQTVISSDPSVFQPENLKQFDAAFFNNNVGNLFADPKLRQSLVEFVYSGGGLMGVHGTTVAFTQWPGAIEDWPEFGVMIGGRGANHRDSNEHVFIKLDDPQHPINQAFGGKGFEYRDEFFRVHEPYSRDRLRVLFSIDNAKTDASQGGTPRGNPMRADNDYALAWIRSYGRGRVFYCTIAHNPSVFWDPMMLQFYLNAIQFALGDLPAPTLPSNRLTPVTRAQEELGWRLGIEASTFQKETLFEAIDKAGQLGLSYMGSVSWQKVSPQIPKAFGPELSADELRQIRLKLDAAGVRLLSYSMDSIPSDEAGCRKVFEFGRKMGIETFVAEPAPEALDMIERFCNEYDINLAIQDRDPKALPDYGRPAEILKVCQGRGKRIGVCGDLGYWLRSGIDPVEAVRMLKDRLITLQMRDLGAGRAEPLLAEIQRLGIKPTLFGLGSSNDGSEATPGMTQDLESFNKISLKLAR